MPTTEETILIDRDPQAVWDFMEDPSTETLWQTNTVEYEQLDDGPVEEGTKNRGVTKVAGKRVEWTAVITEHDPPARLAFRSVDSPIEFEGWYTVEAVGDATRVTYHIESPTYGGFFGKLAEPLVNKLYSRDVKGNLENLKEILESEGS